MVGASDARPETPRGDFLLGGRVSPKTPQRLNGRMNFDQIQLTVKPPHYLRMIRSRRPAGGSNGRSVHSQRIGYLLGNLVAKQSLCCRYVAWSYRELFGAIENTWYLVVQHTRYSPRGNLAKSLIYLEVVCCRPPIQADHRPAGRPHLRADRRDLTANQLRRGSRCRMSLTGCSVQASVT